MKFSASLALVVTLASLSNAQTVHLVAVGVDVQAKGKDTYGPAARNLAELIKLDMPVKKHILTGNKATRQNVLDEINGIKPGPYDYVMVYIGTHGAISPQHGFYMLTAGSHNAKGALLGSELAGAMNKITCRSLLLVDACHSATMLDNHMPRVMALTSCRRQESAFGNIFVVAIRQGVKGNADADHNGLVTFEELVAYLPNGVDKLATPKQHPVRN